MGGRKGGYVMIISTGSLGVLQRICDAWDWMMGRGQKGGYDPIWKLIFFLLEKETCKQSSAGFLPLVSLVCTASYSLGSS